MLFSIFYCTAGKLKRCRNLRGAFTLCLDYDGSEVVDCISVAVDRYIVSFDTTDRCRFWKTFCAGLIFWDASPGSWLICCFNAEYRLAFLCLWFLARGES